MSKFRIAIQMLAVVIYCCTAWFYGIGPAFLGLALWILGIINGREEYLEANDEQE